MNKRKLFETTAVLHPDGVLEVMGGAMRHVKAEAMKTPGARAIRVREVVEESLTCRESSLVANGASLIAKKKRGRR